MKQITMKQARYIFGFIRLQAAEGQSMSQEFHKVGREMSRDSATAVIELIEKYKEEKVPKAMVEAVLISIGMPETFCLKHDDTKGHIRTRLHIITCEDNVPDFFFTTLDKAMDKLDRRELKVLRYFVDRATGKEYDAI